MYLQTAMSAPTVGYGSIADNVAATTDRPFDVLDTYYLKDTPQTAHERRKKCFASMAPILLAIIIMGGIAVWLLANFARLYPTSAVDRDYDSSSSGEHRGVPVPLAPSGVPPTAPPIVQIKPTPEADCKSNAKCHALGLIGQCCPTLAGDTLLCCN